MLVIYDCGFCRYAGVGRDYNATSAIDVIGVPPKMIAVAVTHSAYNGINITMPSAPIVIKNCTLRNNRGIFIYHFVEVDWYFCVSLNSSTCY